jgi:N-acetylglutamate synthase-like GNAT family acetyltransferase
MLPNWTQPDQLMLGGTVSVRPAVAADVEAVAALVNEQARRGHLLPRTPQAIQASLDDWLVAVDNQPAADRGSGQRIFGCVSLLLYHSGLAEVRSMAVSDQIQGQGVGRQLLLAIVAEARQRRLPVIFALTRAVGFFESCGFRVTDRALFPEKVWQVCRTCPLQDRCEETAVVLELSDSHNEGQLQPGWPRV